MYFTVAEAEIEVEVEKRERVKVGLGWDVGDEWTICIVDVFSGRVIRFVVLLQPS